LLCVAGLDSSFVAFSAGKPLHTFPENALGSNGNRTEFGRRMFGINNWLRRSVKRPACPPRVPDGVCVYAIGDIHGRRDLLVQLLEKIAADAAGTGQQPVLVFLGDYVDRGPDSKGVIEVVRICAEAEGHVVALRGNHDQMLLDFLRDPATYTSWKGLGAAETLSSYGVAPPASDAPGDLATAHKEFLSAIPPSHLDFLNGLVFSHTIGDYFFAHAGVRPEVSFDRQVAHDLMWIRGDFLNSDKVLEKVVVHGHTPAEAPVNLPGRICADTGAYATNRLTAVVLTGEERRFLVADHMAR